MGNDYYNPQFNTNMYGGQQYGQPYGQQYGQPMMDRLSQMRQYGPSMQPMQGQMPSTPGNYSNFVKVLNAAEANGYVVAPGNTVYMVSKDYREMYIKTVDMNGDPNMRYFRVSEYYPDGAGGNEYVTRAEFQNLVNENNRMMAMIQQITAPKMEERYERNANESTEYAPAVSADHAVQ